MQVPSEIDEQRFARRYVALEFEAEHVKRYGFTRDGKLSARHRVVAAKHHRANAVRIAKRDEPVTRNHRKHGVRTATALMHAAHRRENFLRR